METYAKINKQNYIYIKEDIKKIIGEDVKILPYSNCVILIDQNLDSKILLKNLKLVVNDLKLKIENDRNNGDKNHEFNS